MTPKDLIERLRTEDPAALGTLPAPAMARLLRMALATLAKDIEQAPEGLYKVGSLGVFRVRNVAPKADGTGGGRVVTFRPAPPKAAAE